MFMMSGQGANDYRKHFKRIQEGDPITVRDGKKTHHYYAFDAENVGYTNTPNSRSMNLSPIDVALANYDWEILIE
jgi:hypothetical protein